MNKIYHLIQGYKNWQKYFHVASVSYNLKSSSPDVYWVTGPKGFDVRCRNWTLEIYITFYYDYLFKKKQKVILLNSYVEKFYEEHTEEDIRNKIAESAKAMMDRYYEMIAVIKASSEYTGQKENLKDSLLSEAKECMLLDNPMKTGLFLDKLISTLEKGGY